MCCRLYYLETLRGKVINHFCLFIMYLEGKNGQKHNLKSDLYIVEVYRKSSGVLQVRKGTGIAE